MDRVSRRSFVASIGAASLVPAAAALAVEQAPSAPAPSHTPLGTPDTAPVYLFFNASEARFIEAACERLIPADEHGAVALAAGVPNYLDKQLGVPGAPGSACTGAALGSPDPRRRATNCRSHRESSSTRRCALSIAIWNLAALRSRE